MIKMLSKKKNEFDEGQMFNRYKYGFHCYGITLFLLLINSLVKEIFEVDFENEFYLLFFILGISASYYIFRLIIEDNFLPNKWKTKVNSIIFVILIVNIMVFVRWRNVTHDINLILNERLIYSDFIENFVLQFIMVIMLISFVFRIVQEKRRKRRQKFFS